MMMNEQELLEYACGQFEQGLYDAALEAFILAYSKGCEKEWILENIYNCYMAGNETEFQRAYEAWKSHAGKHTAYEDCLLDFIPYREGEYYIFDKDKKEFCGVFSIDALKNMERLESFQQMEFSGIAAAVDWNLTFWLGLLKEAEYRRVSFICPDVKRCMSFFKIPELEDCALNSMIFPDMEAFQQYFHEHTMEYLPKMYVGTEEEKQELMEIVSREHAYRLTPEGRNTDNVLLTIAIPTWHRGNLVLKRLENLLPMIYDAEIEIAISKNGTGIYEDEYARAGQTEDARLLYYDHGRDLKYWDNWLYAAGMAHGRYVLFVSDEDDVVTEALEHYLRLLADNPKLSLVRAKTQFQYRYISDRRYGKRGLDAFKTMFLGQSYLSGLIVRRKDFIQEDFARLGQFKNNSFYQTYPHEWWCAVLSQKGDSLVEPVVLIQEANSVANTDGQINLQGYATYEGRIQQFRGMAEFLHWMMDENPEGAATGMDAIIKKIAILFLFARRSKYDSEHFEEWVERLCSRVMEVIDEFNFSEQQKVKLLQELQFHCVQLLKEHDLLNAEEAGECRL